MIVHWGIHSVRRQSSSFETLERLVHNPQKQSVSWKQREIILERPPASSRFALSFLHRGASVQKYNCIHHRRWQKDCTKIEDSFQASRIMRHVGKELSQPAPTRNKQKDTLGEKWTRAVLSMRRINIIYKEPKSPSQPNQRAKLEPEKSLWKQMVESQNPLKKSMETTTQTKRQMSNVKNREPKQDTKETTKQTDATITSANKTERMHGRQRTKELEGGGHGRQDRGISCIEPPTANSLCDYATRLWDSHDVQQSVLHASICFTAAAEQAALGWDRNQRTVRFGDLHGAWKRFYNWKPKDANKTKLTYYWAQKGSNSFQALKTRHIDCSCCTTSSQALKRTYSDICGFSLTWPPTNLI